MRLYVTKRSHPVLFSCFETISHDRGTSAGHKRYAVPVKYLAELPVAEKALATLSAEELETFSIGEDPRCCR